MNVNQVVTAIQNPATRPFPESKCSASASHPLLALRHHSSTIVCKSWQCGTVTDCSVLRDNFALGFWKSDQRNHEFKRNYSYKKDYGYTRPWWSLDEEEEEDAYYDDENDEEFEDFVDEEYRPSSGSTIVLQAFRTLTWLVPAVLLPLLLGNPMAIAMALLIPFARRSLVALLQQTAQAFFNIFEPDPVEPMERPRKSYYRTQSRAGYAETSENMEETEASSQSRASANADPSMESDRKDTNSWGSTESREENPTDGGMNLGGWDDLDSYNQRQRPPRRRNVGGKLSGKLRRKEIPLLLRLLIALFPFLGFWEKYI